MPAAFNNESVVVCLNNNAVQEYSVPAGALLQTILPSGSSPGCVYVGSDLDNNLFIGRGSTGNVTQIDKVTQAGAGPTLFLNYVSTAGGFIEIRSNGADRSLLLATLGSNTVERFAQVSASASIMQLFGTLPDGITWEYSRTGLFILSGVTLDGSTIYTGAVKHESVPFDQSSNYFQRIYTVNVATNVRTQIYLTDCDYMGFGGIFNDIEPLPDGSWVANTIAHNNPFPIFMPRAIYHVVGSTPSLLVQPSGTSLIVGSTTLPNRTVNTLNARPSLQMHPRRGTLWFMTFFLPPGGGFSSELWELDLTTMIPTLMLALPSVTIFDWTFMKAATSKMPIIISYVGAT